MSTGPLYNPNDKVLYTGSLIVSSDVRCAKLVCSDIDIGRFDPAAIYCTSDFTVEGLSTFDGAAIFNTDVSFQNLTGTDLTVNSLTSTNITNVSNIRTDRLAILQDSLSTDFNATYSFIIDSGPTASGVQAALRSQNGATGSVKLQFLLGTDAGTAGTYPDYTQTLVNGRYATTMTVLTASDTSSNVSILNQQYYPTGDGGDPGVATFYNQYESNPRQWVSFRNMPMDVGGISTTRPTSYMLRVTGDTVMTGNLSVSTDVSIGGSSVTTGLASKQPLIQDVAYDINSTNASNISVTNYQTLISCASGVAETRTLPNGSVEGQLKAVNASALPGGASCTITLTTAAGGASQDQIVLSAENQGALLRWTSTGWRFIALNGGASFPVVS